MFVDLRESTRLATGRLPFDALFLFDRYIQVVTAAIRRNGGHATSIAGDGVMSVFGVEGTAEAAVRGALQAAFEVWNRRGHSQPRTGGRAGSTAPHRHRDSCRNGRRRS